MTEPPLPPPPEREPGWYDAADGASERNTAAGSATEDGATSGRVPDRRALPNSPGPADPPAGRAATPDASAPRAAVTSGPAATPGSPTSADPAPGGTVPARAPLRRRVVDPDAPAMSIPALGTSGLGTTGLGTPTATPTLGTPATSDEADAPTRGPTVRLGIWGAARGGKTTFLASLRLASLRGSPEQGDWRIFGTTPEASDFIIELTESLTNGRFPPATVKAGSKMKWRVIGDVVAAEPDEGRRRLFGRRRRRPASNAVDFVIEMQDLPGGQFTANANDPLAAESLDHLINANGLIYLFDPLREAGLVEGEPNFKYFHVLLERLAQRLDRANGLDRGRLPHHVAVCVTKFDDPRVFSLAVEGGWITQDADGARLPRVHQPDAFFGWLCTQMLGRGAAFVRDGLANFFHPDRVRYFVTTSIGFHAGAGGFDFTDYANVRLEAGEMRIRGEIQPMNVLEPLVQVARKIQTGRW